VKIGLISLRFDAPGGVETSVRETATRLARAGHEVEVFASDLYDEGRWVRRSDFPPTVDNVRVHRFPVFKRLIPGLTLPLMPGLIDALRSSDADVLHAHSHRYGHVLQAAAVSHSDGRPLVVSTHYHPADRREPAFKRGLLRIQDIGFGLSAYRVARALVVETHHEAELVAEFAPARKIQAIPPGIDLEEWEEGSGGTLPVGVPGRYMLYSGRIASNKGLPVLFRAVAQIPSAERIPLVLMGPDWGERAALEALASSLGIRESLVWLGHVGPRARYRAVVRGATVFVLPSEYEAFGLVLLEAMAAGVPVIATAVGGVPEVLDGGRYGRIVPFGDDASLAQTIQALLAQPAAAHQLAEAGKLRARQFPWSTTVERSLALYRTLAG
jgi:starch synthase